MLTVLLLSRYVIEAYFSPSGILIWRNSPLPGVVDSLGRRRPRNGENQLFWFAMKN